MRGFFLSYALSPAPLISTFLQFLNLSFASHSSPSSFHSSPLVSRLGAEFQVVLGQEEWAAESHILPFDAHGKASPEAQGHKQGRFFL